jgi:hypothetical protein
MKSYRGFKDVGPRRGIRGVVKIPVGGLITNKQGKRKCGIHSTEDDGEVDVVERHTGPPFDSGCKRNETLRVDDGAWLTDTTIPRLRAAAQGAVTRPLY